MNTQTTLLCLLGMVGLMSAFKLTGTAHERIDCGENCMPTPTPPQMYFSHVRKLENISIAPWTWKTTTFFDKTFLEAECRPESCKGTGLIAEPIHLQIYLPKRVRNHNNAVKHCKCLYPLAVGCTCVHKGPQSQ